MAAVAQMMVLVDQYIVQINPLHAELNPICHKLALLGAPYTGCPRRNVPDFGRVFLMLKYTDITQNTYV